VLKTAHLIDEASRDRSCQLLNLSFVHAVNILSNFSVMKRNEIIALVIVLIIIFGIVIWVASETENEDDNDSKQKTDERPVRDGFLKRLADRIQTMQQDVACELEKWRLTTEMHAFLDRRVNRILTFIKISLGLIVGTAVGLLVYHGIDLWTSILTFCGIACIVVPVVTFFFFTNCMTVQEFVNWIVNKMKQAIFKKYGCDPVSITTIEKSVAVKNGIIQSLKNEMNSH
jgi:hypothetical protein